MKKKSLIAAILFFVGTNFVNIQIQVSNTICFEIKNHLFAQTKYPYSEYPDRYEGIVKDFKLVKGEKIFLISATIDNKEISPIKPSKYNACFYLQEPASVDIELKDIEKSYLMTPRQSDYPSQVNCFSWPSEIPLHYKITLTDFDPLAIIEKYDMTTVVPLILYCNKPKCDQIIYNFCFIPKSTISVLNYKIKNFRTEETVFTGRLVNLGMDDKFYIKWYGKNDANIPEKSAWYYINIESEFKPPRGEKIGPVVNLNVKFYHFAELLSTNLFR